MEQKTPSSGGPDRPARHAGSRKRARAFPKGRQLDIEALDEVRALLQARFGEAAQPKTVEELAAKWREGFMRASKA